MKTNNKTINKLKFPVNTVYTSKEKDRQNKYEIYCLSGDDVYSPKDLEKFKK